MGARHSIAALALCAFLFVSAPFAALANTYGSNTYGGGVYGVGVDPTPSSGGGIGVSYFPNWPTTSGGATTTATNTPQSASTTPSAAAASTAPSCSTSIRLFDRTLPRGIKGEDVKRLQVFLNSRGFLVSDSGDGSPGSETDELGAKTEAALIRFQRANAAAMKLDEFTGRFGEVTRGYVNNLLRSAVCPAPSNVRQSAGAPEDSIAALLARIAELKAMLAKLEAGGALTPSPSVRLAFSRDLQLNDEGEDVRRLQTFLNAAGFTVAQSEDGSPGNETTVFGIATYRALTRFQTTRGLPPTGFFGPMTRALVNASAASTQ